MARPAPGGRGPAPPRPCTGVRARRPPPSCASSPASCGSASTELGWPGACRPRADLQRSSDAPCHSAGRGRTAPPHAALAAKVARHHGGCVPLPRPRARLRRPRSRVAAAHSTASRGVERQGSTRVGGDLVHGEAAEIWSAARRRMSTTQRRLGVGSAAAPSCRLSRVVLPLGMLPPRQGCCAARCAVPLPDPVVGRSDLPRLCLDLVSEIVDLARRQAPPPPPPSLRERRGGKERDGGAAISNDFELPRETDRCAIYSSVHVPAEHSNRSRYIIPLTKLWST